MAKRNRPKWLGNRLTREVHRIIEGESHPAECHLDDIKEEHKIHFKSMKEARHREPPFDAAAPCNPFFVSRENT